MYHPDDLPYNNPKAYVAYLFLYFIIEYLFFVSFPNVYTQFRVTLEKQNIQVRCLINIPNTFKPLPDSSVIQSVPNLSDFGYSSMKYVHLFDLLKFVFRCNSPFE